MSRTVLLLASVLSLAACDQVLKPTDVKGTLDQNAVAQDVPRLDAGVCIAVANKRIDELERQVGELQSAPEKLDLKFLTNRVIALEVQASSAASQVSVAPPKDGSRMRLLLPGRRARTRNRASMRGNLSSARQN